MIKETLIKSKITSFFNFFWIKYCGNITFNEKGEINLNLKKSFANNRVKHNKIMKTIKECIEMNKIAKKAIIKYFPISSTIKCFFEFYYDVLLDDAEKSLLFNKFNEMNIEKILEEFNVEIFLSIDNKNKMYLNFSYSPKKYPMQIINVLMDDEANIYEFVFDSH